MSGTYSKHVETANEGQEEAELAIKIIDERNSSLDPDSEWLEQLVQKTVVKVYKEIKDDIRDLKRKSNESKRLRNKTIILRTVKNKDPSDHEEIACTDDSALTDSNNVEKEHRAVEDSTKRNEFVQLDDSGDEMSQAMSLQEHGHKQKSEEVSATICLLDSTTEESESDAEDKSSSLTKMLPAKKMKKRRLKKFVKRFKSNDQSMSAFSRFKFVPSRSHEFKKDKVEHAYIAGYQFYKMMSKPLDISLPKRTTSDSVDLIESITYVQNDKLTANYEKRKERFKNKGIINEFGNVQEMLLFHGTSSSSVEGILANNFIIEAIPQNVNAKSQQRMKLMVFGKGAYFSEYPAVSMMYGEALLLCKVMPGRCESLRHSNYPFPDIQMEFNSREILSNSGTSVYHVVKTASQILPYCVLKLKSDI